MGALHGAAARSLAVLAFLAATVVVPMGGPAWAWQPWGSNDACGSRLTKADGSRWSCSFVDEFSTWYLDSSKWVVADTASSGVSMGGACFDKNRNVQVGSGQLRLTVTRSAPFTCSAPTGSFQTPYLGASVTTAGKYSQTFGRFEVRMKFPKVTGGGLHGGFWMFPRDSAYGPWPQSGEIDVAEWYAGAPEYVFPSLHYSGSTGADTGWWVCKPGDTTQFHRYGLEWGTTTMTFFLDGVACFSRAWNSEGIFEGSKPFDQPFNLILTAALGSSAPPDVDLPATTVVDYVKAWR